MNDEEVEVQRRLREIEAVLALVREELVRATSKFGPMASPHEGYAVVQEEVDEMWQEVKHGTRDAAVREAVQVAAMGARFVLDICPDVVALWRET